MQALGYGAQTIDGAPIESAAGSRSSRSCLSPLTRATWAGRRPLADVAVWPRARPGDSIAAHARSARARPCAHDRGGVRASIGRTVTGWRRAPPAPIAAQRRATRSRRRSIRRTHDYRVGSDHVAQHHVAPRIRCAVPYLSGTRGETRGRPSCASARSAASREAPWRADEWARIDIGRDHDRRRRSHRGETVPRAGRRQRRATKR